MQTESSQRYQIYKNAFAGLVKPFAWVDMDLLESNTAATLQRCSGVHIRLATKSLRCMDMLKWLLSYSTQIKGLMCYSATEALYLLDEGFDDIIVAYPIADRSLIEQIGLRSKAGARVWLMVDHMQHLERTEEIGKKIDHQIPVWVDVDMSVDFPMLHFGVYRSSIRNLNQLEQFLNNLETCSHVHLCGMMGYEAQISGVGDKVRGAALKNAAVGFLKNRSIPRLAQRRQDAIQMITERGHVLKTVNGGGTGSLESTILESGLTEVTAGSAFFGPALYDDFKAFDQEAAAGFALEVTRCAERHIYTCHGGGYIGSGGAGPDKLPRPYLPSRCSLLQLEGAGEVQTPVRCSETLLEIGDPVFFRHAKAGELCEHFNELHTVSSGKRIGKMTTYRGAGKRFL